MTPEDLVHWLVAAAGPHSPNEITVTYIVDEERRVLVADRHSEHVACAGGRPVRAAGEMCFTVEGDRVTLTRVSNQSTGYCPEPDSWGDVVATLIAAGLEPTSGFDPRCEFRRCACCGTLNLVKGGVFECAVCDAELPRAYNVQTTFNPERAEFQYRVTKYDPRLRDRGAYLRDEWTSFGDIGSVFEGVVLTSEAYQRVEDAYVGAALAFLQEVGCEAVYCVDVENHGNAITARAEGAQVPVSGLAPVIRDLLRAEWWCRVETADVFLHFGYDYYMYVGVPVRCERACTAAHNNGLFVESFVSPYHRRDE